MKRTFATLLAAIGACGVVAFAAPDAEAQHRRHHGHHGGARVGVYIGAPFLFSPWPYYSRPYYDPYYQPVIVREQPVVYVEQQPSAAWEPAPAPQAQAPQQQYWYFCQDTQTYYPHAQNCATPWQRVIPHAPR